MNNHFQRMDACRERGSRNDLLTPSTITGTDYEPFDGVETVLAQVPPNSRLVMHTDPASMYSDRFRAFRLYLRALRKSHDLKTIMVTSAVPGEGKSLSALNLAVSLAERSGPVVLVEADLRSPSLARKLGLQAWPGLVHSLDAGADPVLSLRRVHPAEIYLLPAGTAVTNPIQMLNSDRFARILQRLRGLAEWVVVDSPPVLPVPDALAIRSAVDACVWVIRAHTTARDLVKDAMLQVGQEMIVGILLNQADQLQDVYAKYYKENPVNMLGSGV